MQHRKRAHHPKLASSDAGISLLGTVIGIAVSGIVIMALMGTTSYTFQSQRNVRLLSDFVALTDEVKHSMEGGVNSNCTKNVSRALAAYEAHAGVKPMFSDLSAAPQEIDMSVSYFKPDGSVDKDILVPGLVQSDIEIEKVSLKPQSMITKGRILFDLEIKAKKTGQVLGSTDLSHHVPVYASISDAGDFISCGTGGMSVEERVCGLLSEGAFRFDPLTGRCVKLKTKCYPGDNPYTASCPVGKAVKCATNLPDKGSPQKRQFPESGQIAPRHYRCHNVDLITTRCEYATDVQGDIDAATTKCEVCCVGEADLTSLLDDDEDE